MNAKQLIWTLVAFSLACVLSNIAVAADGPYYSWAGCTPWPYLPPSVYVQESVPYFALHPPVYYRYPLPRPYGYLPYPYLPGPLTHGVSRYRPTAGLSPYVAEQPAVTTATGPEVIVNPYAVAKDPAEPLPEGSLSPRVHVTYPAKMFAQSE
jgi:hypothetical protein